VTLLKFRFPLRKYIREKQSIRVVHLWPNNIGRQCHREQLNDLYLTRLGSPLKPKGQSTDIVTEGDWYAGENQSRLQGSKCFSSFCLYVYNASRTHTDQSRGDSPQQSGGGGHGSGINWSIGIHGAQWTEMLYVDRRNYIYNLPFGRNVRHNLFVGGRLIRRRKPKSPAEKTVRQLLYCKFLKSPIRGRTKTFSCCFLHVHVPFILWSFCVSFRSYSSQSLLP
jgi:hypothetical protein